MHGKGIYQQDPQPERRHGNAQVGYGGHQGIQPCPPSHGADDAEGHSHQEPNYKSQDAQMKGNGYTPENLVGDGHFLEYGIAQISAKYVAYPAEVLNNYRPVQTVFMPDLGYLFFGKALRVAGGDNHADGVAGEQAHREKDKDGDDEEDYYRLDE